MDAGANALPPQVQGLAARERELASAIYRRGATTAKELETLIHPALSNGAIRSMLVRLVRKGILRREAGKRGRGQQFVYLPTITSEEVKRRALAQLSERYFEGSLLRMMIEIFDLLEVDTQAMNAAHAGSGAGLNLAA
jgi:predicted transcriptional regulator